MLCDLSKRGHSEPMRSSATAALFLSGALALSSCAAVRGPDDPITLAQAAGVSLQAVGGIAALSAGGGAVYAATQDVSPTPPLVGAGIGVLIWAIGVLVAQRPRPTRTSTSTTGCE